MTCETQYQSYNTSCVELLTLSFNKLVSNSTGDPPPANRRSMSCQQVETGTIRFELLFRSERFLLSMVRHS